MSHIGMKTCLLLLLSITLPTGTAEAVPASSTPRSYTADNPLIYEGAQDLWPYSFLNDNGQPDGFNIDLMRLLLGKLGIPYEIRMKPRMAAFNDLKARKSDLMIGLTAGFHEQYGYYSENSVTLFTQSVLSPKSKPTRIHNFRDLATHRVFVNDSSLCHHLMVDYGWSANAVPTRNIAETIMQMSTENQGELIWNTLSLKWLLHKFQIDNLEITPVDMPHGEYKFMSNDPLLVRQLDSVFVALNSTDQLLPLYNKWFYPERQEKHVSPWVWYTGAVFAVLLLFLIFYTTIYQLQARRITRHNNQVNRQLAAVLGRSGVRVWTFDIPSQKFIWRNEFGQPAYVYTTEEFSKRYSDGDFRRLYAAMQDLTVQKPTPEGTERAITLDIKAKDSFEDGDTDMLDFIITLSVLRRNAKGVPVELIGTKKDVTAQRQAERMTKELQMRCEVIAASAEIDSLPPDELSAETVSKSEQQLEKARHDERVVFEAINGMLHNGMLRIVSYSPQSHMLTVYTADRRVQHSLTPTRLMTLIDDRMTTKVIRLLSTLDDHADITIDTDIRTNLRIHGGICLHVFIHLMPQKDASGQLKEYLGVLRDISVQKDAEQQLSILEAKTQEIEDTKTTFIRNMMKEIRTPMAQVVSNAEQLTPAMSYEQGRRYADAIVGHAELLTQIINNILYLSRIEAHMIEIHRRPTEFVDLIASQCQSGWEPYKTAAVRYTVEESYDSLVVDIDAEHLGNIIAQVARNAAQHTEYGNIRARYDYFAQRLMIAIDDTGKGIAPEDLQQLNSQLESGIHTGNGLGLAICKELVRQMGGNIEISSEPGRGTTVWIMVPCQASVVKRKMTV